MEIGVEIIAILTLVAMLAGCIDAIAGGGGLMTLPALFLAGISPVAALSTNKLQATAGSFSATVAFIRQGYIEWRSGWKIALFAFLGGAMGSLLVTKIPQSILQVIVPILLLLVALYFLFSPSLDQSDRKVRIKKGIFLITIVPLVGFYDGIFGPGTGSFFMVAFVVLAGLELIQAIANTKLANFSSNFGSLLVFMVNGEVYYLLAICMAVGAFIGAQIGARFALRFGARLVRPLLIVMSSLMAINLLLKPDNPIYQWIVG